MKDYKTCTNWKCPVYYRTPDKEMTRRCTRDLCNDYRRDYNKHDYSCARLTLIIKTEEHDGWWYNGIDMQCRTGNMFGHGYNSSPTPYSRKYKTEDEAVKAMLRQALWDAEHNICEQWAIDYVKSKIMDERQLSLF